MSPPDSQTFADRTILVTGGLGGIGSQVATHFLDRGARVVVTDRPGVDGAEVAEMGPRASYLPLDVTQEGSWEVVVGEVVASHGRLDGLVNIAGVFTPGIPFLDTTLNTLFGKLNEATTALKICMAASVIAAVCGGITLFQTRGR